ncbi:unnamed protein product, partial [Prorocentrum cordatum]
IQYSMKNFTKQEKKAAERLKKRIRHKWNQSNKLLKVKKEMREKQMREEKVPLAVGRPRLPVPPQPPPPGRWTYPDPNMSDPYAQEFFIGSSVASATEPEGTMNEPGQAYEKQLKKKNNNKKEVERARVEPEAHVEPCAGGIFEKIDGETEELLPDVAAGVEEPVSERREYFEEDFESLGEDLKEKLKNLGYFRQRSSTES